MHTHSWNWAGSYGLLGMKTFHFLAFWLQPPWPSLSSKAYTLGQLISWKGWDAEIREVQPGNKGAVLGQALVPFQGIRITVSLSFLRYQHSPNQRKITWGYVKRTRGTHQDDYLRDFPGSPVVKNLPSNVGCVGSILSQGKKIPHAARPKKAKTWKQKHCCSKFNKDFKNGTHEKKKKKKLKKFDEIKGAIQETKIKASSLITSWEIDGEKVETVSDFIFFGSNVTVTAAMKLRNTCSLDE